MDFSKRRVTDLKTCRRINIPETGEDDKEIILANMKSRIYYSNPKQEWSCKICFQSWRKCPYKGKAAECKNDKSMKKMTFDEAWKNILKITARKVRMGSDETYDTDSVSIRNTPEEMT